MSNLFNLTATLLADFHLHAVALFFVTILLFIIAVIAALIAIKIAIKLITSALLKSKMPDVAVPFTSTVIKIFLYVLLGMTIAGLFGVDTTSLLAAMSAVGLAVSLAVKDSLTHLCGGAMIIFTKSFTTGDFVQIGDHAGSVEEIGMVHTILSTPDNKRISLPNGTVCNSIITNYSAKDIRRVGMSFTVARNSDIEHIKRIANGIVDSHQLVLKDPEPSIRVEAHNDLGMELWVKVWCKTSDFWTVSYDLTESCKVAFDKENIVMPVRYIDNH